MASWYLKSHITRPPPADARSTTFSNFSLIFHKFNFFDQSLKLSINELQDLAKNTTLYRKDVISCLGSLKIDFYDFMARLLKTDRSKLNDKFKKIVHNTFDGCSGLKGIQLFFVPAHC